MIKHTMMALGLALITFTSALAQKAKSNEDAEYIKVLEKRAGKIVATLDIKTDEKQLEVRDIIVDQYYSLSKIHDKRDNQIEQIESEFPEDSKAAEKQVRKVKKKADRQVKKLHKSYLSELSAVLTPVQVDKVKDGMTYGVVPLTYKGYLALLPELTEEQKKKIKTYLLEAREIAMDAGSSEKKHYWFGQYKGKINNYLSAAGYNLKEAEKRLREKRNAEKN